MENLKMVYLAAKINNVEAMEELIVRFQPLLWKWSSITGEYDEDCYQECVLTLITSVRKFEIRQK